MALGLSSWGGGHEIRLSPNSLWGHSQLRQILSGEKALDTQCGRERGQRRNLPDQGHR